jgi:hypothetical protein
VSERNSDYQRRNSSAASVHCRNAVLQFGTIAKQRVLAVLALLREANGAWVDCGGFRELSARRSGVAEFRAPQWVALAKQMDFKWSVRRCSSAATAACHAAVAVVTATH